jgi:hypothetical protein
MQTQLRMKKIISIAIVVCLFSCKRDALTTYNSTDNIYFNYDLGFNSLRDTVDFSFASKDLTITQEYLRLPFAVTGAPTQNDRAFRLVIDPASTAMPGVHYELPMTVLHAGRVLDTLDILLKRTADLGSEKKKLILHLEPNELFKTDLKFRIIGSPVLDTVDALSFSIGFSDILQDGPFWTTGYASYFGTFSVTKVKLLNTILDMPLDFWTVEPNNERRAAAVYYAASAARYLKDQAALGNIILDEDGQPMKMGPAFQ